MLNIYNLSYLHTIVIDGGAHRLLLHFRLVIAAAAMYAVNTKISLFRPQDIGQWISFLNQHQVTVIIEAIVDYELIDWSARSSKNRTG